MRRGRATRPKLDHRRSRSPSHEGEGRPHNSREEDK